MATSLPSYAPDPAIIAARLAVLVPSPTSQITSLWNKLQSALDAYDLAVVSSLSSEGISRSMNFDAAAKQVAEIHAAYQSATATAALPAGADLVLTGSAMGFHVSHSSVSLRS